MKLFGSLRCDGRLIYRFKGGGGEGGVEKHCTRASLQLDTVEDLIRIRGQVWQMLMLECDQLV